MTADTAIGRSQGRVGRLAGLFLVMGLGFAGYGSYMHFTMGDRTLGNCLETGACNPWDPKWVVAPLVIGAAFLLLAGVLVSQR